MRSSGRFTLGVLALAAGSIAALAQSAVISARSGLIHYVEGQVYLGNDPVDTKFGVFPEVKENQVLKTEEGRAEVLLTPGVFLRLGENSSFRMITNRLIDTRLEFLSGSAIVEAEEIGKDNSVTVVYGDTTVHPAKKGIYRFDSTMGELRVFDGLAEVTSGDQTVEVKEGHVLALNTLVAHKFDKTTTDALNRWSERRDGYVSMANVGAASVLRDSVFNTGSLFLSGWYWNPYFAMYSYVPGLNGMFYSPFGNPFYSPFDVYQAPLYYYPGYFGNGYGYGYPYNYGYRNGGGGGYSAYNSAGYKTVPVSARASGSGGAISTGHGPSVGAGSGGFSSGRGSSGGSSSGSMGGGAVSHGGGAGGGAGVGGGGGGGHH